MNSAGFYPLIGSYQDFGLSSLFVRVVVGFCPRRPGCPILDLAGKVDDNRRVLQTVIGLAFHLIVFLVMLIKKIMSQFISWQIPSVYSPTKLGPIFLLFSLDFLSFFSRFFLREMSNLCLLTF